MKLCNEFSSNILKENFDYTWICLRNTLHSALRYVLEIKEKPLDNYLVDHKVSDGSEGGDAAFWRGKIMK